MLTPLYTNKLSVMHTLHTISHNLSTTCLYRYGLMSHCKSTVDGPTIALFRTPWTAPVCKASWDEYQCPIIAMRTTAQSEPRSPNSLYPINGCIKKSQVSPLCPAFIYCHCMGLLYKVADLSLMSSSTRFGHRETSILAGLPLRIRAPRIVLSFKLRRLNRTSKTLHSFFVQIRRKLANKSFEWSLELLLVLRMT